MKIAIAKERRPHERRVAATPDTIKRYLQWGFDVAVESGAGVAASISDDAYRDAGASVASSRAEVFANADIVLKVQRPVTQGAGDDDLSDIPAGAHLIGLHNPYGDRAGVDDYAKKNIVAFSMEMVPRISRAQSMDVLSSQSNLTGYKAVLDGAANYGKAMPMLMTAAGRINPAKVFVMGAGVAGLQAIATARRLGGIVTATDVRAASKEEVESLGATFIMVEADEGDTGQTAGGYAKEMSEDYKSRQAELIADHIKDQDIVITTALIPGRTAPILVNDDMIASMKAGAVIVDIAAEQGGNVSQTKPGEISVTSNGVKILAEFNLPSRLATDSSALYSRNLMNFVELLVNSEDKKLEIDWEDEIIVGTCLTRDGKVVHAALLPEGEKAVEPAATEDVAAEDGASDTDSPEKGA
ncbi:MAG: Re/Si-specific NAD(P)(+) transhydrogenase subunit alpha [Alphaproteobacteria bacterium]|nr:Re/Si-specific NAD(P)(+) transhydrogenase subunit alpha [Alphaproteobacteria bacterium]